MPKKFVGENTKAQAARARKTAAKDEETARKEKEKEDAYWRDDDKQANKKLQRKEQQEKKKTDQLQKKAELKALADEEEKSIKVTSKQPLAKVTRAQIQEETEKRNAAIAALTAKEKEPTTHLQKPLEENINRVVVDGEQAHSITEAISILSTSGGPQEDRHPERRLKAAFTAFEAANMARIKEENPTLRLSQLKQVLRKEWMRSPENPLNQQLAQ